MKYCLVLVLLVASSASATKYAPPTRHRVYSQNNAFVLDVNPETDINTVYAASDTDHALWSFSKPVWHDPFLVSNDGQVVVTVPWRFVATEEMRSGVGVEFWTSRGVVRTYPVAELCPEPTRPRGPAPIGESMRTWYTTVEDRGASFTVHTTCGVVHEFSYRTASVVTSRLPHPQRRHWFLVGVLGSLLATLVIARRRRGPPDPALQPTVGSAGGG